MSVKLKKLKIPTFASSQSLLRNPRILASPIIRASLDHTAVLRSRLWVRRPHLRVCLSVPTTKLFWDVLASTELHSQSQPLGARQKRLIKCPKNPERPTRIKEKVDGALPNVSLTVSSHAPRPAGRALRSRGDGEALRIPGGGAGARPRLRRPARRSRRLQPVPCPGRNKNVEDKCLSWHHHDTFCGNKSIFTYLANVKVVSVKNGFKWSFDTSAAFLTSNAINNRSDCNYNNSWGFKTFRKKQLNKFWNFIEKNIYLWESNRSISQNYTYLPTISNYVSKS